MLASSIVFAALLAVAQAEEKWEVVTSDEGRFKVEMPACDQQEGMTPIMGRGLAGKRHEWLRHAEDTIFWVLWYEGTSPIRNADEARWFEFAREEQAGIGRHGKVVSEKKVKVGTADGRDYAYLKDSFGSKTETRARAVIKANSVIVLVASPRKGDKLDEAKADRFFGSLSFDVKPSAPKPEDKPTFATKLLLGSWEVVKSEQLKPGFTLQFGGDGQFTSIPTDKNSSHYAGFYKIKGDTIAIEPDKLTLTVKELTPTLLVLDGYTGPTECRRKGASGARGGMANNGARIGGPGINAQSKSSVTGPGANAGAGNGRWVTVAPKEDGFAVEMPRRPDGDETQGGMGFGVHILTCQAGDLDLLILAVKGPTEVPQAELPKVYERLRDQAAGRFGSGLKVTSEAPVKAGSLAGMEYEMTIDRPAVGTAKGRGRAFAAGKSAFFLLAFSGAADKDLTPDADRFLGSFALGGTPAAVVTKPEPKEARKKAGKANAASKAEANAMRAWGQEVDPDGDVEIEASGDSLTMRVPATPHILSEEIDKFNAPRVVAPARGDFTATVRVEGAFDPGKESTTKKISSRQAGGLILWKDEANHIILQRRTVVGKEGKSNRQVIFGEHQGGKGEGHTQPAPAGPIYLRLERKGGRISGAFSADGKDWTPFKPIDAPWATGPIQVGVMAVNTSTGTHTVTFDDYSLKAK